jgi:hypothetical protein
MPIAKTRNPKPNTYLHRNRRQGQFRCSIVPFGLRGTHWSQGPKGMINLVVDRSTAEVLVQVKSIDSNLQGVDLGVDKAPYAAIMSCEALHPSLLTCHSS